MNQRYFKVQLIITCYIRFIMAFRLIDVGKKLETICVNGILQTSGECLCHPRFSGKLCTKDRLKRKLMRVSDVEQTNIPSNLLPDYDFDEFKDEDDFDVISDPYEYNRYGSHGPMGGSKLHSTTWNPLDVDYNPLDNEGSSSGNHYSGSTQVMYSGISKTITHKKPIEDSGYDLHDVTEAVLCLNGILQTVTACSCNPGFTGEFCDASILLYSGSGEESSGYNWINETRNKDRRKCVNGVRVYHNTCICHFGYTGTTCDVLIAPTDISGSGSGDDAQPNFPMGEESHSGEERPEYIEVSEWSVTQLDYLVPWKIVPQADFPIPNREIVEDSQILGSAFVPVSAGVLKTKTELAIIPDGKPGKSDGNIYRFTFIPEIFGQKSRLEITTCFSREEDIIKKYNYIPEDAEVILKTSCPASKLPLDHLHSHTYEIYIPERDFNISGKYVLTQWHGSPDPTFLKDEMGCIAQIPSTDLYRICLQGTCKQGEIFTKDDHYIGLRYNQGGYPPLVMQLEDRYFLISARSDEKIFIDKGGCSMKGTGDGDFKCRGYPREHYTVIWKLPVEKFKYDQWTKFRWDIKWSEYSSDSNGYDTPGVRTSDAWIRVWMDGVKIVDWIGPCGRNDNGRVPYFKAGIYNPSGNPWPLRFFFRSYEHSHTSIDDHKDHHVRKTLGKLNICNNEAADINRNALSSLHHYRFEAVPSVSKKKCTLYSKIDHMSYLRRARLSRLLVDDYTRKIVKNLIYTLDDQDHKIELLRKRLDKYEEKKDSTQDNDDYDGYHDIL